MPIATLPAGVSSPRAARAFTAAWLEAWDLSSLNERAAIAISELATNAVVHAQQTFELRVVDTMDGGVWMGVTDHLREPLAPPTEQRPSSPSGRGLQIVAGLADDWGSDLVDDNGKTVWCIIRPAGLTNPGPTGREVGALRSVPRPSRQ